jgi:ribonuclease D
VRSVAVLGTGIMGAPMARNLAAAGLEVTAWNRTAEKAKPLAEDEIAVAESPAEAAARAEAVLTMLTAGEAVEEVMTGGGALEAMAPDALWIQTSTVGLAAIRRLADLAGERGVAFADAPVLGTKEPAEAGELIVLAGGAEGVLDRCIPVFEAVAAKTVRAGDVGAGTRLKLVLNSWVLAITASLAEALALAEALGLEPSTFLETISDGPLDVGYAHLKGKLMLERSFPPSFPCGWPTRTPRSCWRPPKRPGSPWRCRGPRAAPMRGPPQGVTATRTWRRSTTPPAGRFAPVSAAIAAQAAEHGRLAIDTEFVSERRYQAMLCLAQVAVADPAADGGVRTEVLDPLDSLDPTPIARLLADPGVEVVVHAGRQDVALLRRVWEVDVTNVFDTQVAAGFLGFGNQEGYESLVRKVLGVRLKGAEGFTRWDRRPLTEAQLDYARDDARLLLALGEELEGRLRELGRLDWAREECRLLEGVTDERDPDRLFERLPRVGRLDAEGRAVARELVGWRERTAASVDRPASFVLPDHALVELARRRPGDRAGLEHVRGLPQQTIRRRGDRLLEALERGRHRDPPPKPPEPPAREAADAPLISLAQALVRQRSSENGIAVELVATQAELAAFVSAARRAGDAAELRVAGGWRNDLVGRELRELLAGRRALSVDGQGRLRVTPL